MKILKAHYILISLLEFLGLGAIYGGGALIISPTGKMLGGLPLSMLDQSPFSDFLIPGIILFLILRIAPCWVGFALFYKSPNKFADYFNFFNDMHWTWTYSIYISFALIIWILVEIIFIGWVGGLQIFYLLYSIPLIFVALLPRVRELYKN